MSTIAYLLLPATGVLVFTLAYDPRARFHGLQAIAFGTVWAVALYAASLLSPGVTQVVFALGALVWLVLLVGAAAGRDPKLPVVGGYFLALVRGLEGSDATDEP